MSNSREFDEVATCPKSLKIRELERKLVNLRKATIERCADMVEKSRIMNSAYLADLIRGLRDE